MPKLIHNKTLLTYFFTFISFTLIFIILFHLPVLLSPPVLFYRGLKLLFLSTILIATAAYIINHRCVRLNTETFIAAIIISISFHLSFFIVFPVTFDRSVTMYLLNTLNESSYSETALEQKFINEYVVDQKAIGRRINEQLIINIIDNSNSTIKLTQQGKNFINNSQIIKFLYNIR